MQQDAGTLLIEATCNQVNQFGGYTGMTPADFVRYVRRIAEENRFPFENIVLGGDHLGPNVWRDEPAEAAMQKAEVMVRDYVRTGFVKIHLDCSMHLAEDPGGALAVEISADRAARLAKAAETSFVEGNVLPRYVIGSEVPIPGGAMEHEEVVNVTAVEDVERTIQVTREAFLHAGLASAWERVIAVVVQPGVEFGDDFVLPYEPRAARNLSRFIESQAVVYEVHSTDYQTPNALRELVQDHFAILKVGPALTFAFREGVFALAKIEDELIPGEERSNIVRILDEVMLKHPEHWEKYYTGTEAQQVFKRRFSLSDRARYYWGWPELRRAFDVLMTNLSGCKLPRSLISQYAPCQSRRIIQGELESSPKAILLDHIESMLEGYWSACRR